jgi:hypothetical protein
MQASAAVVAEIGQVMNIVAAKLQPAGHGRKDCTKALAVAAGVADLHLTGDLDFGRSQGDGMTLGQVVRPPNQTFK